MKVYTKVTRGMEMKMARGRFLGTVVQCVSISPCGAGGRGLRVVGSGRGPSNGSSFEPPSPGSAGGLGAAKGAALLSVSPLIPSPALAQAGGRKGRWRRGHSYPGEGGGSNVWDVAYSQNQT